MPAQPPPSASQARRARLIARRRTVLTTLVVAALNLTAAALVFGGVFWPLLVLGVLALGGYVAVLAQLEARRTRARRAPARRSSGRVPRAPARKVRPVYSSVEPLDAQSA